MHFFDSLQKTYPHMTDFERRESGEYVLEEDREQGSYRWVSLEARRLDAGSVNPPALEDADAQHEKVLETAPYHLDFSPLDIEALDVLFVFDFAYAGNHDEVVAEALSVNSPLEPLVQLPGSRVLNFEPSIMLALDEPCRLQAGSASRRDERIPGRGPGNSRKRRSASTSPSGNTGAGSRSRRWPKPYRDQRRLCQELVDSQVLPGVIKPLAETIAAKQ